MKIQVCKSLTGALAVAALVGAVIAAPVQAAGVSGVTTGLTAEQVGGASLIDKVHRGHGGHWGGHGGHWGHGGGHYRHHGWHRGWHGGWGSGWGVGAGLALGAVGTAIIANDAYGSPYHTDARGYRCARLRRFCRDGDGPACRRYGNYC